MAECFSTVALPLIPNFCRLVVFPSPLKVCDESRFFLLNSSAAAPEFSSERWLVEYTPGHIYCLLPSSFKEFGYALYSSKPGFLDNYKFCHEIDIRVMSIQKNTTECLDEAERKGIEKEDGSSQECGKCFVSHFPRPNMKSCKFGRKSRDTSGTICRLRGGAGAEDQTYPLIIERAILNARIHDINIHPGVRNLAAGNCAFEAVIDSINTRSSFVEKIDGTPDECRKTWMTEVENLCYDKWNDGMSMMKWRQGWATLKTSGTYEYKLGDLVIPGIAHCTKKDILIFNTSHLAHYPVYVIEASHLCGQKANTEVPICLAYDQTHYEAMVPNSEEDELKTIAQKKVWLKEAMMKEKKIFLF